MFVPLQIVADISGVLGISRLSLMLGPFQIYKQPNLSVRSYFIGWISWNNIVCFAQVFLGCNLLQANRISWSGFVWHVCVLARYTTHLPVLVQQDNCPVSCILHCAQTHTRETFFFLCQAAYKREKHVLSYYLSGGCYGSLWNSCIQKGKQIVGVTTINKSLHIYNVGKFSAFVGWFDVVVGFSAVRNINGSWVYLPEVEMCERTN